MKLGVNIDHIATLRQARQEGFPCIKRAAQAAIAGGADSITIHLREDRRHIQDYDLYDVLKITKNVNFEMAATEEMVAIAINAKPKDVCLVPEKREELTTEGGLNLEKNFTPLETQIKILQKHNIKVSLFIEPDLETVKNAKALGVEKIEIHTGKYANLFSQNKFNDTAIELEKIKQAAKYANSVGLAVNAGHGLNYKNVIQILEIKEVKELNIGYFLIAEACFTGLQESVRKMKDLMI